jgi:hypothetical protein
VVEERRLPDAGLAVQDQYAAPADVYVSQEAIQHLALALTAEQVEPWITRSHGTVVSPSGSGHQQSRQSRRSSAKLAGWTLAASLK